MELAGDRLHPGVVEPAGIEHHRELVSGERRIGEDVENGVGTRHWSTAACNRSALFARWTLPVKAPLGRSQPPFGLFSGIQHPFIGNGA